MRQSVSNVVREVAQKHGLKERDLIGPCRRRSVAWPRQEVYFRVFTECAHVSFPESGRRLGGRDHTTVYAGVKRYCQRLGISYADAKLIREGGINKPAFAAMASAYAQTLEAHRVQ